MVVVSLDDTLKHRASGQGAQ